jgi:hypothetical protein
MSKLTAKLSDGTEWEVVNTRIEVEYPDTHKQLTNHRTVLLKPIKPSPPKEVWVNVYDGKHFGSAFSKKEVEDIGLRDLPAAVRYVLAEETLKEKTIQACYEALNGENLFLKKLKEPQPREWWVVCCEDESLPHGPWSRKADAENFMETQRYYAPGTMKIVHVREVLP